MRPQRWVRFPPGVDPHDLTRSRSVSAAGKNIDLPDGTVYVEVEFSHAGQIVALQMDARLRVMPPLETGFERLQQEDQDFLADNEVPVEPGDRVLNIMRSVRNKFAPGSGYDISSVR